MRYSKSQILFKKGMKISKVHWLQNTTIFKHHRKYVCPTCHIIEHCARCWSGNTRRQEVCWVLYLTLPYHTPSLKTTSRIRLYTSHPFLLLSIFLSRKDNLYYTVSILWYKYKPCNTCQLICWFYMLSVKNVSCVFLPTFRCVKSPSWTHKIAPLSQPTTSF